MAEDVVFSGVQVNGVDAKGRVSLPAGFRQTIEDRGGRAKDSDRVKIGKHRRHNCLEVLDAAEVAVRRASIRARAVKQAEESGDFVDDIEEDLGFAMWMGFQDVAYDGVGRMVLPASLRDEVGIGDDALFVGGGATFQIWATETFRVDRAAATSVIALMDEQIAKRSARA